MAINNLQEFQNHPLIENSPALQRLLKVFSEIISHPRPSKNEGEVRQALVDMAREQGWEIQKDEIGNIAFRIPATPGRENVTPVVLQGHMDQVTTPADKDLPRNAEIVIGNSEDPENPGDDLYVQTVGKNMTLGADNGIGVASAMATMMDPTLEHGPVTILVTVDEETGMSGAKKLNPNLLPDNSILINLDSEEGPEGICIGCAGGVDVVGKFPLVDAMERVPEDYEMLAVELTGFAGGHSGVDIHRGRGNAIRSMSDFLLQAQSISSDVRLMSLNGGSARNAIPSSARAYIAIPQKDVTKVKKAFARFLKETKKGVIVENTALTGKLLPENAKKIQGSIDTYNGSHVAVMALRSELRDIIHALIQELPQGPLDSADLPNVGNLVTLSNNLGVVRTEIDHIEIVSMARSANIDALKAKMSEILEMFTSRGAQMDRSDEPSAGWLENPETSPAVALAVAAVQKVIGKYALLAYHAGLESGIISDKGKNMSAVAMGPLILDAHTPRERVNLRSVDQVLGVIREMLSSVGAASEVEL
ncbi:MAG: beta-Ala-His dipeptidase [Candidatus Gracilibacteria bacterium]